MAAIICNILVKPCQACASGCKACGQACGPCCLGLCRCCHKISLFCGSIFNDGLAFLLTVAFVMMGVVATFAAIGLTGDLESCEGPMKIFFIVVLVECVGHLIYAIYGYTRVHNRDKERETFYMALYNLLITDAWTALYIIFDIFAFSWSVVGLNWNDNCADRTHGSVVAIVSLLWICLSYFIIIFNLFFESVESIICFCFFCLPYMLFPCCFSGALRGSYRREENVLQNSSYNSTYPNAGVVNPRGQHPNPPQVSRVREVEAAPDQVAGSPVRQLVGEVGSYLWNKAKERSRSTMSKGSDDRIARV